MVDPKSTAKLETEAAADDISTQIANLRADLAKLTESVSALGSGAKNLAAEEANLIVERARERVREAHAQRDQQAVLGRLTAREQQVLERIVAGRLNKQIAGDLNISIKTVEAHRANIMEKLEVTTVADLMKIALARAEEA